MSARDVIASRVYAFGEDRRYASADAILKALHAAGYRILAPGQIDDWTKERCAEVADQSAVVQHLMRALAKAEEGAGTLPAKESVKLRPNDWHALAYAIRSLGGGE